VKTKLGYEVQKTSLFEKLLKDLSKNFRSITSDLDGFTDALDDKSKLGINLGNNVYKARIANSDKNKGKSAGYRLISYLKLENETITYIYIYDKSQLENISEEKLDKIVMEMLKVK
jgi:mRNA-degrading endonuclease RelE of RelBE toxin-antitoxin system